MNKKAFTLLEILLVVAAIAVLAGIVIVAINPGKQLASSRNAARKSDANAILNSIYQYSLDNKGAFPASIDTNLRMLGTSGSGCDVACGSVGESTSTQSSNIAITDNSQSSFAGTFSNTTYANNLLTLSSGQTFGTYTSDIKDATASATWSTFAWVPNRPTGKSLPNSGTTETGYSVGNASMANNVLLMHLDESSGTTIFTDSSGSNNGGTCSGIVCPSAIGGKINGAMNFDGINTYILSKNITSLAGSFLTASAWVKWTGGSTNNIAIIASKDPTFAFGLGWTPHKPTLWLNNGSYKNATGVTSVDDGKWHHLVGVYDGTNIRLYVDGVQEGVNNVGSITTASTNNVVTIGALNNSFNQKWTGVIDELAIFSRALSATEVSDHYKRGALSLKYQVRSCANNNCSDGTFAGPDGTANSYYSEAINTSNSTPSLSLSNISNNRYFQYKAFLDTTNSALTPELKSATISGSTSGSSGGGSSASSTTATACLDLSPVLAPTYITSLPFDPKTGSNNQTYYAIQKTAGGRINVQACSAENSEVISITR